MMCFTGGVRARAPALLSALLVGLLIAVPAAAQNQNQDLLAGVLPGATSTSAGMSVSRRSWC